MTDGAKQIQIVESFTYDGLLGFSSAVWLFAGLVLFISWMLWREHRIIGAATAAFFFVLRTAAIALVLWMLLGPTYMMTETTSIPQTLAVIVDSSGSMDTAEPLSPVERLRWQQAAGRDVAEHPELKHTDAALATLRFTVAGLRQIVIAAGEYAPPEQVLKSFEIVKKSATRAQRHFEETTAALRGSDDELAERAAEAGAMLSRQGIPSIDKTAAAWKSTDPTESTAAASSLLEEFEQLLRQAEALERGVIASCGGTAETPSYGPTSSRKALVLNAIDRLEEDVLGKLSANVNLMRVRVDEFAAPIAGDQPWREALAAAPAEAQTNAVTANEAVTPPADQFGGAPNADVATGDLAREEINFGPATNLTAAVELLKQEATAASISAAVLLSDGAHNAPKVVEPQVAAAGLANLPIHVVPVSSQEPRRDLVLYRVSAPSSVILNDKIVIEAIVTGQHLKGEDATIELRRGNDVLERQQVEFSSDKQDHRLKFTVPAEELGQQVFDLVMPPLAEESNTSNNAAVTAVRVLRDTTRILLADHAARWEFRYLDQLYRRDKHVKCDKMLWAPKRIGTGLLESAAELPSTVEAWSNYDVAILGDLGPEEFDVPQQEAIEEWVRRRGGIVLVIAGAEHMPHGYRRGPLTELLPVQEAPRFAIDREGYVPGFTPEGARHEALMLADTQAASADLWMRQFHAVPIFSLSTYCRPKPAAHVLLEAVSAGQFVAPPSDDDRVPEHALLAWQDVGAGRVVFLAAPATYHLRFRRGDELHHRFWGQLLRWLTAVDRGKGQSRLLVKTTDSRFEYGKPVEVTVVLSNEDGSPIKGAELATLAESPTGAPQSVPLLPDESVPGRYVGKFEELLPGAYRISATGDVISALRPESVGSEESTALITVYPPDNLEMNDTRGNRTLLREVAEVTGGQVLAPTAVGEILELSVAAPRVIEDSVRTPLWNRWRYFWIVVGCLATEWIVRRRIGLV